MADLFVENRKYRFQTDNGSESMDPKGSGIAWRKFICAQLCGVFIFAVGIGCGILIGIYAYHGGPNGLELKCVADDGSTSGQPADKESTTTKMKPPTSTTTVTQNPTTTTTEAPPVCKKCVKRNPVLATVERSLFDPLLGEEMEEALEVLIKRNIIWPRETLQQAVQFYVDYAQRLVYNGIPNQQEANSSYVQHIFLHPPPKQIALQYLDRGREEPGRFAEVHVVRALIKDPDCMIYKVGPLGKGQADVIKLVAEGEIHVNSRPKDLFDYIGVSIFLGKALEPLAPIFRESFDGASLYDDLFVHQGGAPFGLKPDERYGRFTLYFKGLGSEEFIDTLDGLPFHGIVYTPSVLPFDWYATNFYYLDQGPYNTTADLLQAYYNDSSFRKVKLPKDYRKTLHERIFPKRKASAEYRAFASMSPPRTYEPSGPRYTVNGSKVAWMGWEFFVSGTMLKGPNLFDIKFKGERIAYELAMNEIELIYAGDNYGVNNKVILDATYGLMVGSVIRRLDCPDHATILKMPVWNLQTGNPEDLPIVCIFEQDGQEAYWRHRGSTFAAGLSSHFLVVRVPVSIGNYDYTIEFHFFYDGRLTTKARATGYIQAHFWDDGNPYAGTDKTYSPFGYRVSDYHVGTIHDHTFGFKLDLDILDSNNTFKLIHWKAGDVLDALRTQTNTTDRPAFFIFNQTRYVEWETLLNERGLKLSYDDQAQWTVVNERTKNTWGVDRGYLIQPLATSAQTFDDSFLPMKGLSFTKYHCAVTKQKDDEQYMTSQYTLNRLADPMVYLDKMLDNEPIADQDLVTWISVGFAHVPTSEDVPMTVNVETGFTLKPHNFFDRTESFDMPQYTETNDNSITESEPDYEPCYEETEED